MDTSCKIAVYYIVTGDYKKLFLDFLESLQNFYPNNKKIVKVISDGLEDYKDYENGNVKVDLYPRINDYPWPVITLYKMWHILENFDDSCEYCCYFNGNSIVYPHAENALSMDKMTFSYHSFNNKMKRYNPWNSVNINPLSKAFLPNETYEYVQAAFFFGPNKLFRQLCEDVMDMVKEDTRRLIFAQWHDESYLNKWCVLHERLLERKYILTVYKEDLDSKRFVYLRDKRDYKINKN